MAGASLKVGRVAGLRERNERGHQSEAALLQVAVKRRNLSVLVPNLDIVSINILFGGLNCIVVCAIQHYAIDETAVLTKKVHSVLGQGVIAS